MQDPCGDGNVSTLTVRQTVSCDVVLWFCKLLPRGEDGERVHRISMYVISYHCMHIYEYLYQKNNFKKECVRVDYL